MKMDEWDGKENKTYVVGVLGEEHATWRMQSFKMSVDAATWRFKSALNIRLE